RVRVARFAEPVPRTVSEASPYRARSSRPLPEGEGSTHECRFRIIFAKVFLNFLIRNPRYSPASGPCPCIGSRIIDGYFVFQRVQVRAREALNKVKRFRMRQSSRGQPKLFIKARSEERR